MKKILSIIAMLLAFATPVLAETQQPENTEQGSIWPMLLIYVAIFAIFYLFFIKPQKKKEKEAKAMIEAIKKGDKIVTIGGFHGKVLSVKKGVITLQMGDNKVELENWAVKDVIKASKVKETDEEAQIEEPEIAEEE